MHPWGCGMFSGDVVESLNYLLKDHFCALRRGEEGKALQRNTTRASSHKRQKISSSPRRCLDGNVQMLIRCVSSCCMSSSHRLDRHVLGHVHVCCTPDAERVQVLCKWFATCASGLLHCATANCTLRSHLSFRSGFAWATMDPQLQQLEQLLQLLQASGRGSVGASCRRVQESGSGSQGSGSQASPSGGFTTPKKPQVDEQASNSTIEQTSPPPLQPHFPCKSELLVHHICHMDNPLADYSLEWRCLRDVTPKYL